MINNQATELLPCDHCGSNVELIQIKYPNGEHAYRLVSVLGGCMVCENIESIEPGALDAFIAAWNRRKSGSVYGDHADLVSHIGAMKAYASKSRELLEETYGLALMFLEAVPDDRKTIDDYVQMESINEELEKLGIEV